MALRHKSYSARLSTVGFLFALPGLLGFIGLVVVPFMFSVYFSVTDFGGNFIFLENYIVTINSYAFRLAVRNTLRFSGLGIPLLMVVSMFFALICVKINKHGIMGIRVLQMILVLPIMLPTAATALFFSILFGRFGILNQLGRFAEGGGIDWLRSPTWAFLVLLLLFVWRNFGYTMIVYIAALGSVAPEINEAAMCDGAGALRRFFSISLPIISPAVFFTVVLNVAAVFRIYRESLMLMGEYPVLSVYMFQNYIANNMLHLNFPRVSSASVLFLVFMSFLVAAMVKATQGRGEWM